MEYDTKLTPEEERVFLQWAQEQSKLAGRNVLMDLGDYDLKGYWKEYGNEHKLGHGPDKFKKPNHPTFSNESIYSGKEHEGGFWDEQGSFHPSEWNLKNIGGYDRLKSYFDKYEPGVKIVLSPAQVMYGSNK
jgi:hypothetical protein